MERVGATPANKIGAPELTRCFSPRHPARLRSSSVAAFFAGVLVEVHLLQREQEYQRLHRLHLSSSPPTLGRVRSQTTDTRHVSARTALGTNTLSFITQNMQGLLIKTGAFASWMDIFKTSEAHGLRDIVFLQETHVPTGTAPDCRRRHAATWGYSTADDARPISFWPEGSSTSAGVAVLLNPNSRLQEPQPWLMDRWTTYFCAITVRLGDKIIEIIYTYGRQDESTRNLLFAELGSLETELDLLLGGDFNCTLQPSFDRSHAATATRHDSKELSHSLVEFDLVDCMAAEMVGCIDEEDLSQFHAPHHTYVYRIGETITATSRIDRWYKLRGSFAWVFTCGMILASGLSDHEGVFLRLADLAYSSRIKKEKRMHPRPGICCNAVQVACVDIIDSFDTSRTGDLLSS